MLDLFTSNSKHSMARFGLFIGVIGGFILLAIDTYLHTKLNEYAFAGWMALCGGTYSYNKYSSVQMEKGKNDN